MLRLLRQPYPFSDSPRRDFLFSLGVGTFVTLFLYAFQPFGLAQWRSGQKGWVLVGYGLVTFTMMLFLYFVLKRIWLRRVFREDNHTVGREILQVLAVLTLITIGNYGYSWAIFRGTTGSHTEEFARVMGYTLLIGIFPTAASVFFNYIYQLKKYSHPPQVPQRAESIPQAQQEPLRLVAENGKDSLALLPEALLYIEAADNYCEVVFEQSGQLRRELVRSSLSRLETQIFSDQLLRCHRSYLVNLGRVVKVTGNAQGYKLHLDAGGAIPVARRYNGAIVDRLKSESIGT
ncbi:LytTR family DNA-binding domain-containing protein [Rhabdobacter roseus]|uniref:HTH LytTR-type domain-containing protein n=1 Tax=Rhabdobacter roseus TaxID=1655419 RepID=A0A840TKQ6_9BACT|nr:LytTR family DNA-binding domain-containing protein [Rhabdobacter roseus]MBB5284766.1 hypothetical protein [Rhabdobacter roseus]